MLEPALTYYSKAEVLELRVSMLTPKIHLAGNVQTPRRIQACMCPRTLVDSALGGSLEGFA